MTGPKKKKKPLLLLLDLLIILVALAGLFLLVRPYFTHKQQDKVSQQLLDNFATGDGTVTFSPDELVVDGEDIEYFDDFDEYEDLGGPTGQQTSSPTGENSQQPTAAPVENKPEKVVVQAIARIQIPGIKVDMPVAAGASRYNLRVAIGHFSPSTAIGQAGQAVLFGHRMYSYGRHFNRLGELAVGDEIFISDKKHSYKYLVSEIERILPQELPAAIYTPVQGHKLLLVTCDPVRVASHRLLVKAELATTEKLP